MSVTNSRAIGLKNIGNTCFLNAVIQSLSSVRSFTSFMSPAAQLNDSEQLRVCLGRDLSRLNDLSSNTEAFKPETATNARLKAKFPTHEQQDAHEFMQYIISVISEAVEQVPLHRDPLSILKFSKESPDSSVSRFKFRVPCNSIIDSNHSIFTQDFAKNPFVGLLRSTLRCLECKYMSPSYQKFIDLSLSIPEMYLTSNNEMNPKLEQCLDLFTEAEHIHDLKCGNCQDTKSSRKYGIYKKLSIVRPPQTLCLHIRRLIGNGGPLVKVNHFVSFPLELDMAPYCSFKETEDAFSSGSRLKTKPRQYSSESIVGGTHDFLPHLSDESLRASMRSKVPTNTYASTSPSPTSSSSSKLKYQLVAVIVHHGTHTGGHYTVYKRSLEEPSLEDRLQKEQLSGLGLLVDDASWWHISDSTVKKVHVDQVLKAQAYMLYYEKIST